MSLLNFRKLHGCGNSFVIMHELPASLKNPNIFSRRICSPSFGVGSDGLLLLSERSADTYAISMFNPDGSIMGMCGNGIRCAARYLLLENLLPKQATEVRFLVEDRTLVCRFTREGRVIEVDMGVPSFEPEKLGISENVRQVDVQIQAQKIPGHLVSMGNPHCVIFVEDVSTIALEKWGPAIENDLRFKNRMNVEFAEISAKHRVKVRVWERGAGATLACGTGACATVVAGVNQGFLDRRVTVMLPGGDLEIHWSAEDDHLYLTGPTAEICQGQIAESFLD